MLESFEAATFTPLIETTFIAHGSGADGVSLRLIEAREAGGETARHAAASGRRIPFALVFAGPMTPFLPQRTYRMEHAQLGSFDLFLVPIGPEAGAMRYEAVFG